MRGTIQESRKGGTYSIITPANNSYEADEKDITDCGLWLPNEPCTTEFEGAIKVSFSSDRSVKTGG